MVSETLRQQQQIQRLRNGVFVAQFPVEKPSSGGELKAAPQPGIDQHAVPVEVQKPAVGSVIGGGQGHGDACRSRQALHSPKNSSV